MADLKCPNCGGNRWGIYLDLRWYFPEAQATVDDQGVIVADYEGWGEPVEETFAELECHDCSHKVDFRAGKASAL